MRLNPNMGGECRKLIRTQQLVYNKSVVGIKELHLVGTPDGQRMLFDINALAAKEGCRPSDRCWPCLLCPNIPWYKNHEMCGDMSVLNHGQGGPQHMFKGGTKTYVQALCIEAGCSFTPGGTGFSPQGTQAGAKRRREGKGKSSKGKGKSGSQRPRSDFSKGGKGTGAKAGSSNKGGD